MREAMKVYESSVSPKGQITIPQEVRKRWKLGPRDRVRFELEGDSVQLVPGAAHSPLADGYQSIPALASPLTDDEMTQAAAEEHAQHAAAEGRGH
jgi:AbrB family looped-hinge helix DNA binding protein